ncbi:MAG: triose-phosphate isomerase [Clostridiales bacterium]|jgi:triosephosphate isomerase|nr:triose-phosphate isomerase [Clostridiales bacterium]
MRKPLIAGNWKMNNTKLDAELFMVDFKPLVRTHKKTEIVLCVPYTCLEKVKKLCKGTKIKVGAQNVSWADKGAFTGEISADMLKELGAEYVIIGHSERRQYFGETDVTVNKRTVQALDNSLKPIVCVGETGDERAADRTEAVLKTQLAGAFEGFSEEALREVVIAYEPIWAIGTGQTATPEQANATIKFIRKTLAKMFTRPTANKVRILYGGSMNGGNVAELMDMSDIDGGLVGGASLKPEEFASMATYNA